MPLANANSENVPLVPGQIVQIILAYQAKKDSLTAEHTRYTMTQIPLDWLLTICIHNGGPDHWTLVSLRELSLFSRMLGVR